jgi:hypothetical protein
MVPCPFCQKNMEAEDFKKLLESKDVEIPIELTISSATKMIS